ncbi:pilus assembly protein CpaE [Curtobacterium flaccumfaciens]|uniref:pilus assembly protein CpaE n=1 Tax=Curtobacterium flaccumfaciens TaxID=2035 RepID=UPI001BDEEC01|nr:pilus assembly protein CpaE [Curtobacterium flaccumfaciens]MBT1672674.1 pilus assembly protein CpaE [Curtobacterium flaccumfaciens pv. flaccumfaciens]
MIAVELARSLRDAGLRWHPETGDRFVIDKPGIDHDVYTVSEMTVERHDSPSGTILGFNGTTEWALDSVTATESLWLPREDQLRELLGPSFIGLTRVQVGGRVVFTVTATIGGADRSFASEVPAIAYGQALQAYITAALA